MKFCTLYFTFAAFALVVFRNGAQAAGPACKYNDLDFSALAGKNFNPADEGGYSYDLTICGESSKTCPNDPDGVISGSMVQTKGTGWMGECFVLGEYTDTDQPPVWGPGASGGAQVTMSNGSPNQCPNGLPRQLILEFTCSSSSDSTPKDADIKIADGGDCKYTVTIPTCLACSGGCAGGGGGGGSGGGGGGSAGGDHFFGTFFWVCVILFLTYCIGGVAYNIYRNEKTGLEAIPNRPFWGALPGYTKDGILHTVDFVKRQSMSLTNKSGANTDFKAADAGTSYQNVDTASYGATAPDA